MTPATLNSYQVRAAEELLALAERLPLTARILFECRGIVGGDFDVVVTRRNTSLQGTTYETEITSL